MLAGRRRQLFKKGMAAGAVAMALAPGPVFAQMTVFELFSGTTLDTRMHLIIGIVCGIIAFAVVAALMFLRAARRARRAEAKARSNAGQYDRKRDFLQAVLAAEPQLLVHWNEAGEPSIVANTLASSLGIPADIAKILRFASWLERESALELEKKVQLLHTEGLGFNLTLKSAQGAHIEADGRAAGGGSVLKLRDIAGRRQELADLCEQHQKLGREIDTMRSVLDAMPMPVWLHGTDGAIEWVNRSYVRAVDATDSQEVCREQIYFLNSGDRKMAQRLLNAGETYRGRVSALIAGENKLFDALVLPVGQVRAGVAIEAANADQASNEVNRHFGGHTRILDRISTAIAIFSTDQHLTYFNQAFAELWQLDSDWLEKKPGNGELLDKLREQRLLPEQADFRKWKQDQLAIYKSGEAGEEWWHLPDARSLHVVCDRGADGSVTYLYENLTETLNLQSRYNALIHVQKETLDHLGEGVAVFGSDGRLKLFNPSFTSIWKLDAGTLEREPHVDEVIALCRPLLDDDDAWNELKGAVTSIDDQRQPIGGYLARPDEVHLAYAGMPLPDGAILLTYVDVSATKRMENALIERNEALELADHLKSAFINHISYELRTPLTNIIGFSEFLQNAEVGPLNEKQREYLGDIRSSSDTLLAIIDDILDLATIDAGGLELKITDTNADEIINAAVLGVRESLAKANLQLEINVAEEDFFFRADPKRMTQVLYNLLSNAAGFSEPGGVISVNCHRAGGVVEICVEDHGCGMPDDYQQSAFERFESQPHGSRHRGPGLGLSIVKNLVELHEGSVELNSTPNEGTRVTVRFPSDGPPSRVQSPPAAAE